ncbi:uncharacterized protein LOC119387300 [Rhipicephalus sanguineus]|uniref:Uncharacterized protein n=1 Tax=Rhipicephalus sanguineus TaxID=34632 RepID=A0A9D4Q130_RHISA|nr:uncharacterized protein LOC119387300 [Rhipicephalus sanguineus]KAH7962523.1 hypothetical protein HPB52_016682 [Rhipicephalus sanguineus]
MALGNGPSGELRCADKNCNEQLADKGPKYRLCLGCRRITCLSCNAQHENENCESYKARLDAQERAGRTEASTRDATAGPSKDWHAIYMNVPADFKPGEEYCCDVDGCMFAVRLHEGSTKFWCPMCHSRHRIEGDKLIRAKAPPVFPILSDFTE